MIQASARFVFADPPGKASDPKFLAAIGARQRGEDRKYDGSMNATGMEKCFSWRLVPSTFIFALNVWVGKCIVSDNVRPATTTGRQTRRSFT
jgi:hypothetical protein